MYALLLFILFPVLYRNDRTWYFIYALLFFLIGRFIAYKIGLSYSPIIHNVFYVGILLPFIFDKEYKKYLSPIVFWVMAYVSYLFLLYIFHGNEFFIDLKSNYGVTFVFIFAVEVFENIRGNKIDTCFFVKAFKIILIFEIILCWMQFFFHDIGNFFRITEYSWRGRVMSLSGNSAGIIDNNLCFGTMMSASSCANYLTVSIVSLFLAKRKAGFQSSDYFLFAISVLTLLITGIRAPFVVLLLMLYFVFLKGKKIYLKILYFIIGLIAVIVLIPVLSSIGSQGDFGSFDNSVIRSLSVFTQVESGTITEEGTLTWPLSMIPYIIQHPLFGNGLHYGIGYFMALNMHVLEELSVSDAGVFFYWAEYGLVGLCIFYYFYYYIIKISPRYGFAKSDIRFLVIMLFLLSVVDLSVNNNYCTTVFAIAPIMIYYYQNLIPVQRTKLN